MKAANDNTSAVLLWTAKQTAAALGITTKTLVAHVRGGDLPYVPIGRGAKRPRMGFVPVDVEQFIAKRRTWDCPSTSQKTAPTINTISKSAGNGFTALRAARMNAMRVA